MLVNAVSERMAIDFSRDGRRWHLDYERGVAIVVSSVVETGEAGDVVLCFKPDPTIFTSTAFDPKTVVPGLRELALVVRGLALTLRDEICGGDEQRFDGGEGVADYVRWVTNEGPALLGPPIVMSADEPDDVGPWMKVEIAMQWRPGPFECLNGYTNGVYDRDGGTHLSGLKRALTECLTAYAIEAGIIPSDDKLSGDAVREGLVAVVSLWHCHASRSSPTRHKLPSPEAGVFVANTVRHQLHTWLRVHPQEAEAIVRRAFDCQRLIDAAVLRAR